MATDRDNNHDDEAAGDSTGGLLAYLPQNFSYVVDRLLAGCSTPYWTGDIGRALTALHAEGIRALVSLDEQGLPESFVKEFGFDYLHIPLADFHAPTIEQTERGVDFVNAQMNAGKPVAIHCRAGIGRTGTLIACVLVSRDAIGAPEAIARTRRARPGSIETREQERLIAEFAERLKRRKDRQ